MWQQGRLQLGPWLRGPSLCSLGFASDRTVLLFPGADMAPAVPVKWLLWQTMGSVAWEWLTTPGLEVGVCLGQGWWGASARCFPWPEA